MNAKRMLGLCIAIPSLILTQARGMALPAYECHRTTGSVVIDGRLDDSDWQRAPIMNFYIPVTGAKPISMTEGRVLWDDKNLYVGFKAYDKDIWSCLTERDSPTCHDDCLEVFLKPDAAKDPYFNFEINALRTVYDAFDVKRMSGNIGSYRWNQWNCKGLKIATHIEGTLNDLKDVDDYWEMEVAIPFASLPPLDGRSPQFGDTWLFQLARYDYSIYLPDGTELSASIPLSVVDFHQYEEWQNLKFVR